MNDPFVTLQTQVLATIAKSPLKDSAIGLLWADRYGRKAHAAGQRVFQWRSHGLPLSIQLLAELMDLLGYELKIEKRGEK